MSEPEVETHYVSCDQCDAIFDAEQQYQEPAVDCQVGHDGPKGYVPSLCPACYRRSNRCAT
jgi:hypothetical protein